MVRRELDRPGPGAYDVPGHLLIGGKSSFDEPSRSGSSGFTYGSTPPLRKTFACATSFCDPGQYTIDAGRSGASTGKAEAISARSMRSHNVHANQGRGGFNSVVERPQSAPRSKAGGGPGSYDTGHLFDCGRTATTVTSGFRSSLPANMHVPKSETPGVGTYEPSAGMGTQKQSPGPASASFKGPERSSGKPTQKATGNLGPGSYDLRSGKQAPPPAHLPWPLRPLLRPLSHPVPGSISHLLFEKRSSRSPRSPPFGSSAKRPSFLDGFG